MHRKKFLIIGTTVSTEYGVMTLRGLRGGRVACDPDES
jgi:hypothetical protein